MKKLGIMLIMTFLLVGMFTFASAKENESNDIELPETGSINSFDRIFDNLRLGLTFDKERKAQRALIIAEERFAESEKLIQEGDFERAEKIREAYEKYIEAAEKAVEDLEFNGKKDKSEEALRKIARIQNRFENHQEKIDEMKVRLLEGSYENLTEEQQEKIDEVFLKAEEKLNFAEEKILEKKDKAETKYKVLAELSDDELKGVLNQLEEEEGLSEERLERKIREENRFQRAIQAREENLDRWKERLNQTNLTEEQLQKFEEKILKEESKLEEFKGKRADLIEKQNELREKIESEDLDEEELDELREELQKQVEEIRSEMISKNQEEHIKQAVKLALDYACQNIDEPTEETPTCPSCRDYEISIEETNDGYEAEGKIRTAWGGRNNRPGNNEFKFKLDKEGKILSSEIEDLKCVY